MTIEQIIQLMNSQLEKPLTPLQKGILYSAWEGETYAGMAISLHYQEAYIKNIASQLWQELSKLHGDTIVKSNFRIKFETSLPSCRGKVDVSDFSLESVLPPEPRNEMRRNLDQEAG